MLALALTLALSCPPAGAPATSPPAGRVSFRSYGPELGLQNLAVTDLAQDGKGFLWASTQDGLYRYDGSRFQRYARPEGLPSAYVTVLHVGADHRFWAGTWDGLARYAGGRFSPVGPADGLQPVTVNDLASAPGGALWVATKAGLFHEEAGGRFVLAEGWPGGEAGAVHLAPDGTVWASRSGALLRRAAGGPWTALPAEAGLGRELIAGLAQDRQGRLWAHSRSQLWMLPPAGGAFADLSCLLPSRNSEGRLVLDRAGNLLVPTVAGILSVEGEATRVLDQARGLPTSGASIALVDASGSLWVGSVGLHRQRGRGLWSWYSVAEGLPNENIWSITRGPDGTLWVGTDDGLAQATPTGWRTLPGSKGHSWRSLVWSADGRLWAGGSPGRVLRVDPATGAVREYGAEAGLDVRQVFAVALDRGQRVWAATSSGLFVGTPGPGGLRFARFEHAGAPVREDVGWVATDAAGSVWATPESGLLQIRDGAVRRFTQKDGLRSDHLGLIALRRDGQVCVSYFEPIGMSCFRPGARGLEQVVHHGRETGLPSDMVYAMGDDHHGRLWVGTAIGAAVLGPEGTDRFGKTDGMPGDDCDAMAIHADADGDVWLGTSTGLGRFSGAGYQGPPEAPRAVIVEATLGDRPVAEPFIQARQVPFAQNALEVRFSALGLVNEARVAYELRLLGLDDRWRATDSRQARYAALPPGSYEFEMRARYDGGPPGKAAALTFLVLPAWWQTWWFTALAAAALAALVALIVAWRLRSLRARNRQLEALVAARTAELASANEALTTLSLTDPLTGLKNRRFLDATIGGLVEEVTRLHARPPGKGPPKIDMVFIMVDLDQFKAVNDTYGHAGGDRVLQQTRELLLKACRKSDIVVRWGGEEFLVVARNTRREHGHYLAERIRAAVRGHPFDVGGGAHIRKTCSVGWAAFPFLPDASRALSWEEVVQVADRCLYQAKRTGRDRSIGALAASGLDPAGLVKRIDEELDELVRAGALTLVAYSGEERGFEPALPSE